MSRKLPKPKPKKPVDINAEPQMTDEQRVALAAVTSLGGTLAGEADIGEMQALIAAAEQGRKNRPAGAKEGPGTKRKPGPRRRKRG